MTRGLSSLHTVWRMLPGRFRRTLYENLTAALASTATWTDATPRRVAPPFVVAGALSAPTGLGEAARLILRGLLSTGAPVTAVDLSSSLMQESLVPLPSLPPAGEGPGTLMLVAQPPNVAHAIALLGKRLLKDKLRVGCWVWDLEVLPQGWGQQARFVHRIATPSRFCATTFSRALQKDVLLLPYPISDGNVAVRGGRTGTVNFGAALDLGSTAARKNPTAPVQAYRRAFADATDVHLILKVRGAEHDAVEMRTLKALIESPGPTVELVLGDLDPDELNAWWRRIDVFVSLHRSEGFGLLPAEAMLRGIPVIASDWSATAEFVTEETGWPVPVTLVDVVDRSGRYDIPGAVWAEPDLDAASRIMRMAVDRNVIAAKGLLARATIKNRFSADVFAAHLYAEADAAVGTRMLSASGGDRP